MKIRPLFFLLFAYPVMAQIPSPQIPLAGNIGAQGFPVLNSGTLIMATDANRTMTAQETSATGGIKVTSSVSLTATRNLVIPAGNFQFLAIENATTGGQAIQVIGPTGTGVTIPNGSSATVWFDATNMVQTGGGGGSSVLLNPIATQNIQQPSGTTLEVTQSGTFGSTAAALFSALVNSANPSAIYAKFTTSGTNFDGVQGAIAVPSGSTQYQANGVTGYIQNSSPTTNSVASAGYAYNAVSGGGNIWGANFAAIDATGTPWNYGKGIEVDVQPQAASTAYTCSLGPDYCSIGLQLSLYAPNAGGYGSAVFINRDQNAGSYWRNGVFSANGAAGVGIWLGTQSATTYPSDSQLFRIDSAGSSGTIQTAYFQNQASTNSFILYPPSGGNFLVNSGNLNLLGGGASFNGPAFNANSTSPTVGGYTAVLNTTSATSVFGYQLSIAGTTPWQAGFRSFPGATPTAIWAGPSASGNSQPSQSIRLDATSGSGTTLPAYIQEDATGNLDVTPQSGSALVVTQGSFAITSGHATAAYFAGSDLGNSSAPTGSCTPNGIVSLNQDATASRCVSGTWANYAPGLSLTTTGTSGAATLSAGVLNIPQYSGGGGGTVNSGTAGQLATYSATGTAVSGTNALPPATTATPGQTGSTVATNTDVANFQGSALRADLFSGATFADKINACNAAVVAAGGGTCDDSFLGGPSTQTTETPLIIGDPANTVRVLHILPLIARWTWNINSSNTSGNTTTWAVTQYGLSGMVGPCNGGGACNMVFTAATTANMAGMLNVNPGGNSAALAYIKDIGFQVSINSGTVLNAVPNTMSPYTTPTGIIIQWNRTADESVARWVFAGTTQANVAWYVTNTCCALNLDQIQGYASAGSFGNPSYAGGGVPLFLYNVASAHISGTFNAAGTGYPNIYIAASGGITFDPIYEESNCLSDTTTPINYIASTVGGIEFSGGLINHYCGTATSGSAKYAFENHSPKWTVHNVVQSYQGATNGNTGPWINDIASGRSGLPGFYNTANGGVPPLYTWDNGASVSNVEYHSGLGATSSAVTYSQGSQTGTVSSVTVPYNNTASGQVESCGATLTVSVTGTYYCNYNHLATTGSTAHTGSMVGLYADTYIGGSGTVANAYGAQFLSYTNSASAALTNSYGVYTQGGNAITGGTVTNNYSFYAASPKNSGAGLTAAHSFGLYLAQQYGYGIYQSSATDNNYFAGPINLAVTQTTVSCSTSGSAVFSQPLQGTSDKKVLIHMAACIGTASYNYPTAFTNAPSVYASNNVAASIVTTISTAAVTVTGATTTGSLVLEDY